MSARARAEYRHFAGVLVWYFKNDIGKLPRLIANSFSEARPAYCARCGAWAWCTKEMAALSTSLHFLCEECADENDKDTKEAWSSYYGRHG